MKVQSVYLFFFLALSIVSSYGCSILPRVSVEQAWSENYAFASGTQANDPAIIDGNPETIGQSQYVEGSADVVRDHSAPSEAVVILPEPKPIHRVVIYSSNLEAFGLWVTDGQGRWEMIKEVKSNKDPVIELRLKRPVNTAGIKIRVRRTSDDAEQRRKNVRRVRGYRIYSGKIRAPAKIGEIELYGFVSKEDTINPSADASEADGSTEF